MPGKSSLDGGGNGISIPDFSHEYYIWVMPHDCPQTAGKGNARFSINLCLVYIHKAVFYGVFNCHNVALIPVQLINGCVKGGRLTGAGWTTNEYHTQRTL